jgi:hypothetical protein
MNGLSTLEMKTRGAHERGRNPAIGKSIPDQDCKTVAFPSAKGTQESELGDHSFCPTAILGHWPS